MQLTESEGHKDPVYLKTLIRDTQVTTLHFFRAVDAAGMCRRCCGHLFVASMAIMIRIPGSSGLFVVAKPCRQHLQSVPR